MKIPIESSNEESEYSVYVYGALDVRLFPNKRSNVDLKNIEIWVSRGLNHFNFIKPIPIPKLRPLVDSENSSNRKETYV